MKAELYKIEFDFSKDSPSHAVASIYDDKTVEVVSADQDFATYLKELLEKEIQSRPTVGLRGGGKQIINGQESFVSTLTEIKFGEPKYGIALGGEDYNG